jgi:hypothetical protein
MSRRIDLVPLPCTALLLAVCCLCTPGTEAGEPVDPNIELRILPVAMQDDGDSPFSRDVGCDCVAHSLEGVAPFQDCRGRCRGGSCQSCNDLFAGVPPVRIFPRLGNFTAPPGGPGDYSLCDWLTGHERERPPPFPYPPFSFMPPSFFDADFRYVDDPDIGPQHWGDNLKRLRIRDDWMFSTGGQVWWRYMNERNSRLSGVNNDYHLYRTRVFGDLWYRDQFRTYVEFIDARIFDADLPPLPIDATGSDLLNAFVDVKVADLADKPAYVRVGRQEMLLGSQRMISTLDWANTRRTFQGVRAFRQGERFDIDLFWMQPVIPDRNSMD